MVDSSQLKLADYINWVSLMLVLGSNLLKEASELQGVTFNLHGCHESCIEKYEDSIYRLWVSRCEIHKQVLKSFLFCPTVEVQCVKCWEFEETKGSSKQKVLSDLERSRWVDEQPSDSYSSILTRSQETTSETLYQWRSSRVRGGRSLAYVTPLLLSVWVESLSQTSIFISISTIKWCHWLQREIICRLHYSHASNNYNNPKKHTHTHTHRMDISFLF